MKLLRLPGWFCVFRWCLVWLVAWHVSPRVVDAGQFPSLFRGVAVADSPLGVRVVSVEEASQADLADLRPEDLIMTIDGKNVHSIDEFAVFSRALKGRATATKVLVFRNGVPHELSLHLYSYPILRTWGIEVIPDYDLRFAEATTGLEYWCRLGRGFEEAHQPPAALNAYLNGLHHVPTNVPAALEVVELSIQISQDKLDAGALAEGVATLRQALLMMEKLFDYPLSEEQLERLRQQLRDTLGVLKRVSSSLRSARGP